MARVVAVVLTYNRSAMLERCLQALVKQTISDFSIIVIDNASTDSTEEILCSEWLDRVDVWSLSRNIGAAGGFSAGLRLAYASGADFVWVMDDDVIVEPDALEELLAAEDALAAAGVGRAFLVSNVFSTENQTTNVPDIDARLNKDGYQRWSEQLRLGVVPVSRATFNSILLPRAALERHGLPVRQMYIWGDDTEYTARITDRDPGFVVGRSHVVHARKVCGPVSIATETEAARIGYHRLRVRNEFFTGRHRFSMVRYLGRQLLALARVAARGQFCKAWIIVRGVVDGIGFNPAIEPADTPLQALDPDAVHHARRAQPATVTTLDRVSDDSRRAKRQSGGRAD